MSLGLSSNLGTGSDHAPGLKLPRVAFEPDQASRGLGHGLAGRQSVPGKAGTKVGLAENMNICVPVIETTPDTMRLEGDAELNAQ